MRRVLVLLVAALVGCGSIPPLVSSGKYFTTEHMPSRFDAAMDGARAYCGPRQVRHLGTTWTGWYASSQFECVP